MGINSVSNVLVKTDKVIDYIPGLSTVSNLVNIVQKAVFLLLKVDLHSKKNHYYKHLDDKSFLRCILLLIPVLGNIVIKIADWKEKQDVLKAIADNPDKDMFSNLSYRLKCDIDIAWAALYDIDNVNDIDQLDDVNDELAYELKKKWLLSVRLTHFPKEFNDDYDVVLAVVSHQGDRLQDASERLQNNTTIVKAALQQDGSVLEFVAPQLISKELALIAVKQDPVAIDYAGVYAKDPDVIAAASEARRKQLLPQN